MWRDAEKSAEGGIGAEVRGVESVRRNKVSPDRSGSPWSMFTCCL